MKKTKLFLAITLALAMCLASFSTAFAAAATYNSDNALVNTDGNSPVQAAVTKVLEMPVGTSIPDSTFTYAVTPVSLDGDTTQTAIMPALGANSDNTVTINFAPGATALTPALANGDDAYYVQSSDIFSAITSTSFPHAGVYEYTITENSDTNPTLDSALNVELGYSKAQYTLKVYVANLTPGPGTYIYALGTVYNTKDDGTTANDVKVDPTPGSDNSSGNDYSQMMFTNTYVHTNNDGNNPAKPNNDPSDPSNSDPGNPTPPNPLDPGTTADPSNPNNPPAPATTAESQQTLVVSKTVTGALGDKSEYFSFNMKVAAPTLQAGKPAAYWGYVVDNNGSNIVADLSSNAAAPTTTGTDGSGNPYIIFPQGADTAFQLKDGQKLVIINAAVGSTYDVTESASDHAASLVVTTNGVSAASTPAQPVVNTDLGSASQLVGEAANSAAYTNNRDMITPTGLTINDLPFVGPFVLAVGALAVFIIVKSRRRRSYNQ